MKSHIQAPAGGEVYRVILIGVLLSIMSSCSIFHGPYVDEEKIGDGPAFPCRLPADNMTAALKCSSEIKSRYVRNMGDQAMLATYTGIGLIPLTAYTIGLAANDNFSNVSDLAIGSAGGFALARWLATPERTQIYGLGLEAIQCVEEAVRPFMVVKAKRDRFVELQNNLTNAQGRTASKLTELRALLKSLKTSDSEVKAAREHVREVEVDLAKARAINEKANDLLIN